MQSSPPRQGQQPRQASLRSRSSPPPQGPLWVCYPPLLLERAPLKHLKGIWVVRAGGSSLPVTHPRLTLLQGTQGTMRWARLVHKFCSSLAFQSPPSPVRRRLSLINKSCLLQLYQYAHTISTLFQGGLGHLFCRIYYTCQALFKGVMMHQCIKSS